ncbi:MAG: ABC transporter permease [Sphingomonadales bacterium]
MAARTFARIRAIAGKEWLQMRRDRTTMMMMVMMPVMQVVLFGYAINTDPRNLPTQVELRDDGPATRAILAGLENSEYFDLRGTVASTAQADSALRQGKALFVVTIPQDFERRLAAGEQPQILLDSDATDPVATSAAAGAFSPIVSQAVRPFKPGKPAPLEVTEAQGDGANPIVHRRYNPAGRTALNIVPGLLGVILTLTMMLMTAIALTRERERGTLESLLASPARPAEVMAGKTIPFIAMGLGQTLIIIASAGLLFNVPMLWDVTALAIAVSLFITVNLLIGFFFSTLAESQLQAMQMTFMAIMPSIMLSGFMFPFAGMPLWAQSIGYCLPTTHFIVTVRAIILKAATLMDVWPQLLALTGLCVVFALASLMRYRNTLD